MFRNAVTILFLILNSVVAGQDHSYILKIHDPSALDLLKNNFPDIHIESIFEDLDLYMISSGSQKNYSLKSLQSMKGVSYIHHDLKAEKRRIPNDPLFPEQWSLNVIEAAKAWDISTGGKAPNGDDIVVAIFDDGYEIDHPDYAQNIWYNEGEIPDNGVDDDGNGFIDDYAGWNSTTSNDVHRRLRHGTSVAGIIGATGNNGFQMAGLNWNVKMMLTSAGRNDFINLSDIVKAYNYIYTQRKIYNETAGARGAFVVVSNYSGGAENLFPEDFPAWCEVYDALGSVGILSVTSAPNKNVNVEEVGDLPTLCTSPYLIVVTNSDRQDNKVQNAGWGTTSIDIAAPGDGILTTTINQQITNDFPGASASAPHVTGTISLMYSILCEDAFEQALTNPTAIANIMRKAVFDGGEEIFGLRQYTVTGKRLNTYKSVQLIKNTIGDCCQINLNNKTIKEESCQGASDIAFTLNISSRDIKGNLIFSLTKDNQERRTTDSIFQNLEAGNYQLRIFDSADQSCSYEQNIFFEENTEPCPFGEFGIESINPNPSRDFISVRYNLSEQQLVNVLLYNNLGQKVYHQIINPELSQIRTHDINVSHLPPGVYYVSLQATYTTSTRKILVINR